MPPWLREILFFLILTLMVAVSGAVVLLVLDAFTAVR